jgi:DNA/RNA-binding domain of Phe-tRNA-synthetase-like protein
MIGTITLEIEQRVIDSFPEIAVGGFLVKELDSAAVSLRAGAEQMESARAALAQEVSLQNLVNDPRIRDWRDAFTRMGLKASTFKCSAEQLARRLLKGDTIRTPLPVVDTYCAISARHLCPMGGYDLDRLQASQVAVRFARPETDRFTPLSGRREDMPLSPYTVVYACGDEVICWAFNYRDSRTSCLSPETQDAVFFSEAVTRLQLPSVERALEELRVLLADAGAQAGEIRFAMANKPQSPLAF